MGLCFSKKKGAPCDTPGSDPPPPTNSKSSSEKERVKKRDTKKQPAVVSNKAAGEQPVSEKKPVFVVTQNSKSVEEKEKKRVSEVPAKKSEIRKEAEAVSAGKEVLAEEIRPVPVPVRTSSCTKEEVDAILIQCGRLSRSSSGKTSNEAAGGERAYRRYSGSKRSFDFDHERKAEEYDDDEERPAVSTRPSPHRRTPGRDRSGSRERGFSGSGSHSRRVSRSPGRRTDGGPTTAGSTTFEKSKPPAKMVSVPAREKPSEAASVTKKVSNLNTNNGAVSVKRNASPRSRSPASNGTNRSNENVGIIGAQPVTLSRSSSRKAEHSPYRRNPMAEIDENLLKGNQIGSSSFRSQRTESMISSHKASADDSKPSRSNAVVTNCIRDQFVTCRVKDQENNNTAEAPPFDPLGSFKSNEMINFTNITLNDSLSTKKRSSRRSSRDFDHHGSSNSYTNIILEDIQNYHQNNNNGTNNNLSQNAISFTVPECVSKACSILEAVADLNSSSSEGRHVHGYKTKEPFLESEVAVKNDLMEPSMHKYVSVRDLGAEVEPQESAGSNSVVGQPWAGSTWEPNSADSTDRYMAGPHSNNNMEEVEHEAHQAHQARHDRRLLRGGSSASGVSGGPNTKKRETVDRQRTRTGTGTGTGTGGVRPGTRAAVSASGSDC